VKRGTPDHWKMDELARLMKIPARLGRTWANGCMERLWHYTARLCPRGNIGAAPDWAIADACGLSRSDAPALIQALLQSKWIETHSEFRLIVHDWHEHADDSVKKTLKNRGLEFCFPENSGTPAETFRPPLPFLSHKPEPEPLQKPPSPKNGSGTAHGSRFDLEELPLEWQEWSTKELRWSAARSEQVFAVFGDYWRAKPGAGGRKADWFATWKNWCRRDDGQPNLNGMAPQVSRESATEKSIRIGKERLLATGRL
jgi:hypothetical protein